MNLTLICCSQKYVAKTKDQEGFPLVGKDMLQVLCQCVLIMLQHERMLRVLTKRTRSVTGIVHWDLPYSRNIPKDLIILYRTSIAIKYSPITTHLQTQIVNTLTIFLLRCCHCLPLWQVEFLFRITSQYKLPFCSFRSREEHDTIALTRDMKI